jgi:hypothetical protein
MELIDLLFAIIEKFVPINPPSLAAMRNEAKDWRASMSRPENSGKKINEIYLKFNEPWGYRLLWAVLYLPIVKWLASTSEPDNELE